MEKKQLIEIICIIAGVSLAIKAIDYMQYFISALFQLLGEQSYVQWYYFFIYLFTLTAFIGMALLFITRAAPISQEISKRLDPSDILIGDGLPPVEAIVAHTQLVAQILSQQGVFLGGKDMRTDIDAAVSFIDVIYLGHDDYLSRYGAYA